MLPQQNVVTRDPVLPPLTRPTLSLLWVGSGFEQGGGEKALSILSRDAYKARKREEGTKLFYALLFEL